MTANCQIQEMHCQITKKLILPRTNLSQHYLNADSADVFFECSDGQKVKSEFGSDKVSVPAHKIVLASVSSVFQAMFYGPLAEGNSVKMTDVTAGGLKEFLSLFYKDELVCSQDHVPEILYLAEKYDVPECLWECSKFLMLNRQVYETENFLRCPQIIIRNLLHNRYLKCEGEYLLKACIDWAEYACRSQNISCEIKNIRIMLENCLSSIEFASVKHSSAINYVEKFGCLFDETTMVNIFKLICEKVAAPADYNPKTNWPYLTHIGSGVMDLKEGQPCRMAFETLERFLLHGVGFHFPFGADDISLLVSIEKINPKDQEKLKIFVGRLSFKDKFVEHEGVFLSSSLPDILLIHPNMNYVIEVTSFEDVKLLQYGIEHFYTLEDPSAPFSFVNEPFAVLQITKL